MAVVAASLWPGLTQALVNLLLPPFFFLLSLVVFLASFGKSLGVRRLYVRVLLKVFEVRSFSIIVCSVALPFSSSQFAGKVAKEDKSQKKDSQSFYVESDSESDDDSKGATPKRVRGFSYLQKNIFQATSFP